MLSHTSFWIPKLRDFIYMTLIELRALRSNGMCKQHWKITTTKRLMSRFRREYGDEICTDLNAVLDRARSSNNTGIWYAALDPFIKRLELETELSKQIELEKKKAEKEQQRQLLEEQKKKETESRRISDNVIRVSPLVAKSVIVKRTKAPMLTKV